VREVRVTIHDVARRAGVSINTVSRVVNDRPDVREETRTRVREVIAALGYRPNGLARSLVRRQSRTLGLIVTDTTNPNTARQVRVFQQTVADAGYATMIFDSEESAAREGEALAVLDERAADGIAITPAAGSALAAAVPRLLERGMPVVLLNREVPGLSGCDAVLNDNAAGARAAVAHLVAVGRRRIAYVTARLDVSTVRDRLHGYHDALAEAGIPEEARRVIHAETTIEAAAAAARTLLAEASPPDAIFAYNDLMAVGVLAALLDAGRRVPDDIALVGYDDITYAPHLRVPLTTVAQPTDALAAAAATCLLDRLRGDESPPRRVVLAPRLVVRASSGSGAERKIV